MTLGAGSVPPRGRVDFEALKQDLLARAEQLVPQWLPGGRFDGPEWKCADLSGGQGGSCSVNVKTGQWADFANDKDKGGDLISLYAAIHGMEQDPAARELIEQLGISGAIVGRPRVSRGSSRSESQKKSTGSAPATEKGEFVPVVPVPANAPPPKHPLSRRADARVALHARWPALRVRVPLHDERRRQRGRALHVRQEPRSTAAANGSGSIGTRRSRSICRRPPAARRDQGVVEGEKCADALHALIGEEFDVLTWPGGTKAVDRAATGSWLAPRTAGSCR
jgi:putative DNA primase/helicase